MNTQRDQLIDLMNKNVMATIQLQRDLETKMMPLVAIWLPKPIRTSREVKRRIVANDLVKMENGILVDCHGLPTHKILGLAGTVYDTKHSITVECLSTHEIKTIEL